MHFRMLVVTMMFIEQYQMILAVPYDIKPKTINKAKWKKNVISISIISDILCDI